MRKHLQELWHRIQAFAGRPWYLAAISGLAALDLFILVVPSDALLISAVLLQPNRWVRAFLWVSTGSALGALLLAFLIYWDAQLITEQWFPSAFTSDSWRWTNDFIASHGTWALTALSFSPLPQQPAVAVSALAGMSPFTIFCCVWLGRVAKYSLFAWLASHAPKVLFKVSVGRQAMSLVGKDTPGN